MCGTPFFPRVLVHLVGLDEVVRQRGTVRGGGGAGLDLVPQVQQVWPTGPQFAGQLGGGHPLGEPPQDQKDLRGGTVGSLPGRGGEQVEDPAATLAPMVDDRGVLVVTVDGQTGTAAAGTSQAVGVAWSRSKSF